MKRSYFFLICLWAVCNARPMRTDHLYEHQCIFTQNVAKLIQYIYSKGYKCTLGEVFRTREQAIINATHHVGIVNSNHCSRMAIDLNLFKDDKYITTSKEWQQFGEYWLRLNPWNEWGGQFKNTNGKIIGDYNHFEMD